VATEQYPPEQADDELAAVRGQVEALSEQIRTLLILTEDPAAPGTDETWHSLGSPSATNFTSNHGRYRMTAEGQVEFDIQLTAAAGGGTSGIYTYANTLPIAYRPSSDRFYPVACQGTWLGAGIRFPGLKVFADGHVDVHLPGASASGTSGANIRMPLD